MSEISESYANTTGANGTRANSEAPECGLTQTLDEEDVLDENEEDLPIADVNRQSLHESTDELANADNPDGDKEQTENAPNPGASILYSYN